MPAGWSTRRALARPAGPGGKGAGAAGPGGGSLARLRMPQMVVVGPPGGGVSVAAERAPPAGVGVHLSPVIGRYCEVYAT